MIGYIYQIINNETEQRYIGKTIDIQRREKEHLDKLRQNSHINKKLQNAWNTYGEDAFSFVYKKYEIEDEDELNDLEINTIKEYDSYTNGYNLTSGGDGGNTRGKLSYEDYCIIYLGCQWKGMTEKIGNMFNIDSSTVSAIFREKAYINYKQLADKLPDDNKKYYQDVFRSMFAIRKIPDENRVPTHLTSEEYFYCLCIATTYGRGIEQALANFFNKHKSFLSNGIKGKTKGKAYEALQKYLHTDLEEVWKIGEQKFNEWHLQEMSKSKLNIKHQGRWRN